MLAVQTSTPRNADCILPPLKTPATDFNSYFQASEAAELPQVWHCQGNGAEVDEQEHQADSSQFMHQPHLWPGRNNEENYVPDDTVRQADFQAGEDDEMQYLHVDDEGHEHFANVEGCDVDARSEYSDVYYGQTVIGQGPPVHACPAEREPDNQLFSCAQSQQNGHGQILSEQHWNQQLYELEQQDVTDVGQLQTADSINYYGDDVQTENKYGDSHRDVTIAGQPQWSTAVTFARVISNAAQSDCNSVGTSTGFENNMLSTWPRSNVAVAPLRQGSGKSPTKFADAGDDEFGGYRVQFKQQRMEQFHHTVSAAGDGCQKMTAEQTDAQTAAANTITDRLQQAFLQSGKQSHLLRLYLPSYMPCLVYC